MKYRNYRNENGGIVRAHVVTEATEGTVMTVDGPRTVLAGDVVSPCQNEFYVDIHDGEEFGQLYDEVTDEELDEAEEETERDLSVGVVKGFDPNVKTAREVNEYLSKVRSEDEYNRVVDAERNGRNRASAVPARDWE